MKKIAIRNAFIVASCLSIILSLSILAQAGQVRTSRTALALQLVLNTAGLETQQTIIRDGKRFIKALAIEGPEGTPIVLGIPKGGIRRGVSFPLSIAGVEYRANISEAGIVTINVGDEVVTSQGLIDGIYNMMVCIIEAVEVMDDAIGECESLENEYPDEDDLEMFLCVLEVVFDAIADVLICTFEIL